ncbi:MAG: ubiquinol-cytochrome c reductase iron-sulfur subunit [Stigonema ocellatum SAG 48.90 = DSM 106950]|nr:ubiquinol-cytochrome c reductase iron-sulfur subunit [Stigonema ocellatum SAG 48.90 = DSM 106950]
MNRRDFITSFGVGWIASSLPVALAACSAQTTISKDWQSVGTIGDLDKTGQLLTKNSPLGPVLVVGTSKTKTNNLIAVNPICTHKGCTVEWKSDAKKFECPCHGAEYGADGKVQKGPAKQPLKTYAAKIEGNSVLVK